MKASCEPVTMIADYEGRRRLRQAIYLVLVAASIGGIIGRVLAVNSVDKTALSQYLKKQGRANWDLDRPFLSGNDRSRWATARSLVEHGTYAIDDIISQPNWDTIDMVKHDDRGRPAPSVGQGHLYSSKPPLLATIMAGEYWIIHQLTGATLGEHPYAIGRFMLITLNVIPLAIYFWLLGCLAERFGTTDFGRIFMVAAGALATFLSTFAIVITNHLPAAISAAAALAAAAPIVYAGERRWRYFILAGFFAAFTAANELPALSFFCLLTAWVAWKAPLRTLVGYTPAAAVVIAAALATNYLAHGSLIPAYAHREPGNNWYEYQYLKDGKVRDSYWSHREARSPVDQGEPSRAVYALNVLIGHHGIFSLTPIWLLSIVGMIMMVADRARGWPALGAFILILTVVCIVFYIGRPLDDRNYGGTTSGFRWVFWLAPLWLVALLPAVDAMSECRWLRLLACILLAFSALSVSYPTWNPWVQPWLTDLAIYMDWARLGTR